MSTSQKDLTVETLVNAALRLLTYRQRSRGELEERLRRKYGERVTDELLLSTLERLDEFNLLNDVSFARDYVQAKLRMGKGELVISRQLYQKGIDKKLVSSVLASIDPEEWVDAATKALSKRLGAIQKKPRNKQKQAAYAYLYGRGYPARIIRTAIDEVGV